MGRVEACVGSALFFLLAPGTVAGLLPWWITGWRIQASASATVSVAGAVLTLAAAAALIECFARFALRGGGTPAPIAPTEHLVVTGLYRHVRNPMYVAVLGLIFGQMLLFGHAALLAYGVTIFTAFHLFVVFHEEPTLRTSFPEEYAAYCNGVPRWIPRLTPWRPERV